MAAAGYNPAAVLDLWRAMSEGEDNRGSGWLSTHPNPDFRMSDMARNLSPALKAYNDALDAGVRPRCHIQ
jgi:predicted Zn-dependent protease